MAPSDSVFGKVETVQRAEAYARKESSMSIRKIIICALLFAAIHCMSDHCSAQDISDPPSGPDRHELTVSAHSHLLGNWGGLRSELQENGVTFDFQYVGDHLWNIESDNKLRLSSWNRFRGTVDLNLDTLAHWHATAFHATAVWQTGDNIGQYLGLLANPSGLASANTFRLDSWWIERRFKDGRFEIRAGQFAAQDFYGAQHYAASFILEPMGYALGNLGSTYESSDPPSTPAAELRIAPLKYLYAKSMVFAADRIPYAHNPTGLVPQFKGAASSASEIGVSPGQKASEVHAFDNVDSRRGYSGLYQFGAVYNPGRFSGPGLFTPRNGDYVLYWMANQAVWRADRAQSKGLDATASYDWSPADVNRNDREFTAGLRYNEPFPFAFHNTLSLGYVRNHLSPDFKITGAPLFKTEEGVELNTLLHVTPSLMAQPVLQYYANVGGGGARAVVFGLRTKIDF
jgi:porin